MRLYGQPSKRYRLFNEEIPSRVFERGYFAELQELLIKADLGAAFENWKEAVDLDKLELAIKNQDEKLLLEALNYDALVVDDIDTTNAASVSASANLEVIGLGVDGDFVFQMDTDRISAFFKEIELDRIENITEQARKSLDAQYKLGLNTGGDYQELARDIRDNIGLNSRQSKALANYKLELAKKGDLTRSQIESLVTDRRAKMLDYRAQMIARTETTKALAFGVQESGMQLVDEGLFHKDEMDKQWISVMDGKTSASCISRDMTIVSLYAMFPDPSGLFEATAYPPGHVGCRADIILVIALRRRN